MESNIGVESSFGSLQITADDLASSITDVFSKPAKEVAIQDAVVNKYKPLNTDDVGPYIFVIPSQGNKFTQLNSAQLFLEFSVHKGADDLVDADNVATVNAFLSSFIDKVAIKINGIEVPGLGNTNLAYKAYAETICTYGKNAIDTHLKASGFFPDTAGQFDTIGTANKGWEARKLATGSDTIQYQGLTHSDFLGIDRLMPPSYEITIEITRNSDDFLLLAAATGYNIKVKELSLYMKHVSLESNLTENILQRMKREPILLPFNKLKVTRQVFASGIESATISNLIRGILPKTLMFFMTQEASSTSVSKNPFNFQNFGTNLHYLRVNGMQKPASPLTGNFSKSKTIHMYREFLNAVGIGCRDDALIIDPDDYNKGYTIFFHDLTSCCSGYHIHETKTGTIDAEFAFDTALTNPISLWCIHTYDAVLHLSEDEIYVGYNLAK